MSKSIPGGIPRATKPYEKNRFKLYDCPEPGCDRIGKNGFKTPQAIGQHRKNQHKLQTRVEQVFGTLDKTPIETGGAIDPAAILAATVNAKSTLQLAVMLMQSAAIREAPRAELAEVFAAILSTKPA